MKDFSNEETFQKNRDTIQFVQLQRELYVFLEVIKTFFGNKFQRVLQRFSEHFWNLYKHLTFINISKVCKKSIDGYNDKKQYSVSHFKSFT